MYTLHEQFSFTRGKSDESSLNLNNLDTIRCTSGEDDIKMQSERSFDSSTSSLPLTSSVEVSCSSTSPVPLNTSSSTRSACSSSSQSRIISRLNPFSSPSQSPSSSLPLPSFHQWPVKNNCYFNSLDGKCNSGNMNECKGNKVPQRVPRGASASLKHLLLWPLESSPVTAKVNTIVTTMASTIIITTTATATAIVTATASAARMAKSSPRVTVFPSFHGHQSNESLMYKEDEEARDDQEEHHQWHGMREDGEEDECQDDNEQPGQLLQLQGERGIFDKPQRVTSATTATTAAATTDIRSNGGMILRKIKSSQGKSRSKSNLLSLLMLLMAAISSFTQEILAIRITHLSVPELIYKGEPYWLNCSYDLDSEPLYSIKWFKKLHEKEHRAEDGLIWSEFYRFIPNDDEIKKSFNMKGVKVDLEKSNLGNVYIQSGDFDSEGTYKCEVSADAPSFETVREVRDARIYFFAENQPTIKGIKAEYGIGEYVNASCSIAFTKPQFKSMTRLTWFINGESVPHAYIRSANNRNYQSNSYGFSKTAKTPDDDSSDENSFLESYPPPYPLFTGSNVNYHSNNNNNNNNNNGNSEDEDLNVNLNIKFLVNPKHFINGIMRLRCTASSIPELYSRSTEEVMLLQSSRGPSSRFSSDSISKFQSTPSLSATAGIFTCRTLLILLLCSLADLPFNIFT